MSKYDDLETTAQRVYKYLLENIPGEPKYIHYNEIAEEVGRTRSGVSYAMGVLMRAGKVKIEDGKIAVIRAKCGVSEEWGDGAQKEPKNG